MKNILTFLVLFICFYYFVPSLPKNSTYGFNYTLKSVIDLPNNIPLASSASAKIKDTGGINLIMYIAFAAVYIMFIHFAVGIKNEFNIFLMIIYFALGGVIGSWLHSYEAGLVFSIILSLIFF